MTTDTEWLLAEMKRTRCLPRGNGTAEDWCDECGRPGPHELREDGLTFCTPEHRDLYLTRMRRFAKDQGGNA